MGFSSRCQRVQEALGLRPRGVRSFISKVDACKTEEAEAKVVQDELAKIRTKLAGAKALGGSDRKLCAWKLVYAYMLGYDVDFGQVQVAELCRSPKLSEKTAGYLAVSLFLDRSPELLSRFVDCIKDDLASADEHIASLAMKAIGNTDLGEFADSFFMHISTMLLESDASLALNVKRKGWLCLLRVYRRDVDSFPPDIWRNKIMSLFQERDIPVLCSVATFVLGMLERGNFQAGEWADIVPTIGECLNRLGQCDCPDDYLYFEVPAPWLQTKLLRILQLFPASTLSADALLCINAILSSILTSPMPERVELGHPFPGWSTELNCGRESKWSSEYSIRFEALNLMLAIGEHCDPKTAKTACCGLNAVFDLRLHRREDLTIWHLSFQTMGRIASNSVFCEHLLQELRFDSLLHALICRDGCEEALTLFCALCTREHWKRIMDKLLVCWGDKACFWAWWEKQVLLRIATPIESNAPSLTLYVDTMFRMLESAPDSLSEEVWFRVVSVVWGSETGVPEQEKAQLRRHAAGKAFHLLASEDAPNEVLVKLGACLLGEFSHFLPQDIPERATLDCIRKHYESSSQSAKAIILLARAKLLNASSESLEQESSWLLKELQGMLRVEDPEVRWHSAEACAKLALDASADVVAALRESLKDDDSRVQAAATCALRKLGEFHPGPEELDVKVAV